MRILISYLIIFSFLSCKKEKSLDTNLSETVVSDCNDKSIKIILPKGWKTPDRYDDGTGFIQTYIYPDSSYVTIMCDKFGELKKQSVVKENEYAREEKFDGFSAIYGNVKKNRKAVFDLAFEEMNK